MIAHYIETYNSFNWGKFVLLRHSPEDLHRRSALPGQENASLLYGRKWDAEGTFITDLQTGEGCVFYLDGGADEQSRLLNNKHQVWVCPMFEPFVRWLADTHPELARGGGDITSLPSVVELPLAPTSMAGYRREGAETA